MISLTMHFIGASVPVLDSTEFTHPSLSSSLVCVRGKTCGVHLGRGTFQWTRAVQAMAILVVKSAIDAYSVSGLCGSKAVLSGGAGSFAASLDYALDKKTSWLLDMFGITPHGELVVRRIILRSNPGRKRQGPVLLSLHRTRVSITLDGVPVSEREVLEWLLGALQSNKVGAEGVDAAA